MGEVKGEEKMIRIYCDKCKLEIPKDHVLCMNLILKEEKITFELCTKCNEKTIRKIIDTIKGG